MTAATKPGTNGVHDSNGHAPAPLTPVSDDGPQPNPMADGRTVKGTFAPGNKLGKGNPFTRKLGAMRKAFLDAVTPEEVGQLARELWKRAIGGQFQPGDLQAAALFLAYAVGKPTTAVDPDRLDLEEWKLLDASPTLIQMVRVFAEIVSAEDAVAAFAERKPVDHEQLVKRMHAAGKITDPIYTVLDQLRDERQARVGK